MLKNYRLAKLMKLRAPQNKYFSSSLGQTVDIVKNSRVNGNNNINSCHNTILTMSIRTVMDHSMEISTDGVVMDCHPVIQRSSFMMETSFTRFTDEAIYKDSSTESHRPINKRDRHHRTIINHNRHHMAAVRPPSPLIALKASQVISSTKA